VASSNSKNARARRSDALALVVIGATACGPRAYVQPALNEPHALLEMRHVVHAHRGPMYGASTSLGKEVIDERTLATAQHDLDTNAWTMRIRPEVATYAVGGHSYHMEQRQVQRTRQVPETYSCPQQQCTYQYPNGTQCSTVYNTCTRYRSESYTETQTVAVDDDACARSVTFAPIASRSYVIQFDYLGGNQCNARCFEKTASGLATCPIVPAR
jgi:hypothetical protein